MVDLLDAERVGGAVHSLPHIESLDADDCNVVALSSRSLYILQNLSILDATFVTRYATEFVENTLYEAAVNGAPSGDTVINLTSNLVKELQPVTCDLVEVLVSIQQTMATSDCGCNVGQGADSTEGSLGGDIPRSVGSIVYEEPAPVSERKCKASNSLHFTIRDIFVKLEQYEVDNMAVLGFALALGVIVSIVGTVLSPLGLIVLAVAGGMATFAGRLLLGGVDLGDLVSTLNAEDESLICAFAEATDIVSAKADYLAVLTAAGRTDLEVALVGALMSNAVLNVLFFDTAETAAFWPGYTPPYDCSGCTIPDCGWTFVAGLGTGDLSRTGSPRTLTSVPGGGGHFIQIEVPPGDCNGINWKYQMHSVAGWTFWFSASYDSFCGQAGGGQTLLWDHSISGDPIPTIAYDAALLRIGSTTPFTLSITLFDGVEPPCLCCHLRSSGR